jgi:hypothetical protein
MPLALAGSSVPADGSGKNRTDNFETGLPFTRTVPVTWPNSGIGSPPQPAISQQGSDNSTTTAAFENLNIRPRRFSPIMSLKTT